MRSAASRSSSSTTASATRTDALHQGDARRPPQRSIMERIRLGLPIINALREGLTANRIEGVVGIVNGTTNFILSEMRAKGIGFATALSQAQALGYAEADPTFDVQGIDAAHKATVMSALAFGVP